MPKLHIDPKNALLWRDDQQVPLSQKAFAVLQCLVSHHRQLVTREILLAQVWPNSYVTEDSLRHYILELRKALGDNSKQPQCIETVRGRGYRLVAEICIGPPHNYAADGGMAATANLPNENLIHITGRDDELAELHRWFAYARNGSRQIGFISGEPGIGKSALVSRFLSELARQGPILTARGFCSQLYGTQEPLMPVVDALEELCSLPANARLLQPLRNFAPSWFALFPNASSPSADAGQSAFTRDNHPDSMLRELAHFLEAVSSQHALVLWFEDLHWADQTTLRAIAYLALRQRPARLLILCTKLPVETQADTHPIKSLRQELRKRGQHFNELRLQPLTVEAVTRHLQRFFPGLPASVAEAIHRHTGGYALFMAKMLDHLIDAGVIKNIDDQHWHLTSATDPLHLDVPETLRQLIEHQFAQLDGTEQQLLEIASVAGTTFRVDVLASALRQMPDEVEAQCEQLARAKKFIRPQDPPTASHDPALARYEFIHLLYHQVIYERVAPFRRAKLHSMLAPLLAKESERPLQEIKTKLAQRLQQDAESSASDDDA